MYETQIKSISPLFTMFAYELDLLVGSIKDVEQNHEELLVLEFSFYNSLEHGFTITDDPLFYAQEFYNIYYE